VNEKTKERKEHLLSEWNIEVLTDAEGDKNVDEEEKKGEKLDQGEVNQGREKKVLISLTKD